jgi:MFS transporter, NNP family, nitrate/nitrite transporter
MRALAGGFALAFTAGFNVSNVGAVADQVSAAYGVGLFVVGLFTTGLFITHAGLQIPMGRLCDRIGAQLVGVGGLVIVALASTAALGWKVAWFAIAMRTVAGIGTAAAFVGGSDYIRVTVGTPVAQGLFGAMSMVGAGLALALIPLWGTWYAPFVSAAAVALAGVFLIALAPREPVREPLERVPVYDKRLLPLGAWHAASFGLSVVIGNWVVTLLHRAGGLSHEAAGLAGALVLFLGVISRPAGGRWVDRLDIVRASLIVMSIGVAALAIAKPLPLVIVAAAVVGLAAGVPFAPAFAGASRLRPDAPAAAVGLVNMVAAVTILVGTPLLGLSFSLPSDGRVGFLVVAVLCGATAATVRR